MKERTPATDAAATPGLGARLLAGVGRRIRPLFQPDHDAELEHLLRVARDVKALHKDLAGQRADLASVQEQLRRQTDAVKGYRDLSEARRAEDMANIRQGMARMRGDLQRQATVAARLIKRSKQAAEHDALDAWVRSRLERLAQSDGPILIGPWTGEVGFELLYWVPFVRWAVHKFRLDPSRLVVMSRGGTRSWYHPLATRYLDVFEHVTPDQFRQATSENLKQRMVRQLDRDLIRFAARRLGTRRVGLLHPSLMYHLFVPVWKKQAPLARLADYTRFERLGGVDDEPVLARLPKEYVAVRFYFSQCFPDTPDNRALVGRTLASLTERTDVVMLNPGFRVDDHYDYVRDASHRVHTLDDVMVPERNLGIQTAVISRAKGFVGTYGGFAYLAPFYGVNAMAFYSILNFFIHHLEVSQEAFDAVGGGKLVSLDAALGDLATAALGSHS